MVLGFRRNMLYMITYALLHHGCLCIKLRDWNFVISLLSLFFPPLKSLKFCFSFCSFPSLIQVLHRVGPSSQPVYLVTGLKPYHVYNFTITLCTKAGCVTSLPSTGQTLPAGKAQKQAHMWWKTVYEHVFKMCTFHCCSSPLAHFYYALFLLSVFGHWSVLVS